MNLYPEDSLLPGIETHILLDKESCPERIFAEETAGFPNHHATLFCSGQNDATDTGSDCTSKILIDKTGITDLECDQLSGRSFTASGLRNLASSLNMNML